jgi:hypothetical protein
MLFFNKLIALLRERVLEFWYLAQRKDPEQYHYYFSFLAAGFIGVIREWYARDMAEPTAQMAAMAEQLILHGMRN